MGKDFIAKTFSSKQIPEDPFFSRGACNSGQQAAGILIMWERMDTDAGLGKAHHHS
jgi:hypothetical protein